MTLSPEAARTSTDPTDDELAAIVAVLSADSAPPLPSGPAPAPGSRWRAAGRIYRDDALR